MSFLSWTYAPFYLLPLILGSICESVIWFGYDLLFRLVLYGLVELKVNGDGNCQVYLQFTFSYFPFSEYHVSAGTSYTATGGRPSSCSSGSGRGWRWRPHAGELLLLQATTWPSCCMPTSSPCGWMWALSLSLLLPPPHIDSARKIVSFLMLGQSIV